MLRAGQHKAGYVAQEKDTHIQYGFRMEVGKAALFNVILRPKAVQMFRGTPDDGQLRNWLIPTGGFASTQLVSKLTGLVPHGQSKAGLGVSNLESTGPDGLRVRRRFPRKELTQGTWNSPDCSSGH